MAELQMGAVESQFADMIWELEPVHSRELVRLAEEKLDWKKILIAIGVAVAGIYVMSVSGVIG